MDKPKTVKLGFIYLYMAGSGAKKAQYTGCHRHDSSTILSLFASSLRQKALSGKYLRNKNAESLRDLLRDSDRNFAPSAGRLSPARLLHRGVLHMLAADAAGVHSGNHLRPLRHRLHQSRRVLR